MIASLVMHPVLAAVSSSCHTTCHLTNKLLTLQSWSQSLLLQKPKLRHTATLDKVSLEGGDSLARYLFPIISLNFQLGWCSHNLRSWTGFTESINLVIFYTKLCVYVHFFLGKEVMSFWILIGIFQHIKNHLSIVSSFSAKDYQRNVFEHWSYQL